MVTVRRLRLRLLWRALHCYLGCVRAAPLLTLASRGHAALTGPLDARGSRCMDSSAHVSVQVRGVRVAIAVNQTPAGGTSTHVSIDEVPAPADPLHGPSGQESSSHSATTSDSDSEPEPPAAVVQRLSRPLRANGNGVLLTPRARVARAYRAGQLALRALNQGDADRGDRTPGCGLPSRSYVLLRPATTVGGRPTPVVCNTWRALLAAADCDVSTATVVYHGFPSTSEANAYLWGAGVPQS